MQTMTIDSIINPTRPSPAQTSAGHVLVFAISETIRTVKQIPSGELYAMLCARMSADAYDSCIAMLKRAGLVSETAFMLTWTGPEFAA